MLAVKSRKIAFIGAGNVSWHLAQALATTGHQIISVYSRTMAGSKALAYRLPDAQPTTSLDLHQTEAEIVLIAIPDAALATVAEQIKVKPGTVVAHTSGSQPLSMLGNIAGASTGVFYPLQTFSKVKPIDLAQVPILVEATHEHTQLELEELALSISHRVLPVDSAARQQLHLAAVFACNFTNHLLGISQQLLQEAGLPTELLLPLIKETIAKAAQQNPYTVQTGPAIRHDANVIQAHLQMLQRHPDLQALYQNLTVSIQETGKKGHSAGTTI
ncbi:Rossmann-like and DUF2520 domain-containing protein [Pontibacter sp. MBLB2868]|uniref:Rossmann-like and DUF2520 domain-containing protein n=1 Tax=Pontibacter sp. MBLB2868 TaxID=3451555 RepID=UPI003F752B87